MYLHQSRVPIVAAVLPHCLLVCSLLTSLSTTIVMRLVLWNSPKYLATERSSDIAVPAELCYPAGVVSHCVPVARKRHAEKRMNVKCKKQVRIFVANSMFL